MVGDMVAWQSVRTDTLGGGGPSSLGRCWLLLRRGRQTLLKAASDSVLANPPLRLETKYFLNALKEDAKLREIK